MGKRKAQQQLADQHTSKTNIIMEQRNELMELVVRKDEAIQTLRMERLETELDSAVSESADHQARIDDLTALVTKLRQSQTELQTQTKSAATNEIIAKLKQELEDANSRLAVTEQNQGANANLSKIKELIRDNTEMRKALLKVEAERNVLTAQAAMLEHIKNGHKQEIEKLQKENKEYGVTIAAREIFYVSLKAEKEKTVAELAEKRRKIQQLELRNEQLSSLNTKQSNSNMNLGNEVASLKKKLTEEKASNEILRKKLDVMQASAKRLNTEPRLRIYNARDSETSSTPSAVIIREFMREQSARRTRDGIGDSPECSIGMVVACDICERNDFHGFGEEPGSCVHAKSVKGNKNKAAELSQSSSLGETVPRVPARQKDRRKRNVGGSKNNGSKR